MDTGERRPDRSWGREVEPALHRFGRGEVPVFQERVLEPLDRRPLDAEVRVAPVAELRVLADVLVADVQPAREPGAPVHDDDLAVVPQVHAQRINDR